MFACTEFHPAVLRRISLTPTVLLLMLMTGCAQGNRDTTAHLNEPNDTLPGVIDRVDLLGIPTIYSIGESSLLTFEPGKSLEIKILGNDLHDQDLSWNISATGIAPLHSGSDYTLREAGVITEQAHSGRSNGEDNLSLIISPEYVSRIKSGDPLSITIQIANNRLTRRFAVINESDEIIDQQIAAVGRLRVQVLSWQANARNAVTTGTMSEAESLADMQFKCSQGIQPILESLLKIREITYRSRSISRQVMKDLQTINPSAPDCDDQFLAIIDHLVALRGLMREFLRNNVAYAPVVSSASRRFVLFSAEDYRQKFLASSIPLNEINAFPMPDEQVRRIFGPLVAKEFFVVALSMGNASEQDRLVNTGMIKAAGRALICPGPDSALGGPALNFTIPIEVVPQSTEQVYTMVSDSKPHETREWIFRSLEFGGALATAVTIGFSANMDLIKAVGLFSGVAIPGAKALWPDDVQGYLRNIIAFGMPDLVKINSKSTVGHRVLFFSKEKLQLMVSDPLQFHTVKSNQHGETRLTHPDQFVIQLAFDSLMVTFDNVSSPTKGTTEERLADARRSTDSLLADLRQVAQAWNGVSGDIYARQLRLEDWNELGQWLDLLAAGGPATTLSAPARTQAIATIAAWRQIHELLAPTTVRANLTNHETYGIPAIQRLAQELENAQSSVAVGQTAQLYQARVNTAESVVKRAGALLVFHRLAAVQLREIHLAAQLTHLGKGNDLTTAEDAANQLRGRLLNLLEAAKPVTDLLALPQPVAAP